MSEHVEWQKRRAGGFVRRRKWIHVLKCRIHNCRGCRWCDTWIQISKIARRKKPQPTFDALDTFQLSQPPMCDQTPDISVTPPLSRPPSLSQSHPAQGKLTIRQIIEANKKAA